MKPGSTPRPGHRAWLALTLLLGLCASAVEPAWAAEVPRALRAWLHATDTSPTADQLRRTSPDVEAALAAVAADSTEHRFARLRAVALLSRLGTGSADERLRAIAKSADARLRATALMALGAGLGRRLPKAALPALSVGLRHADRETRLAAARALGLVADPAAAGKLAQRALATERDEAIRQALTTLVLRARPAGAQPKPSAATGKPQNRK